MSNGASPGRPSSSLHFIVGEMNGKLDTMLLEVRPALSSLNQRVVRLERWQWGLAGAGGLVGVLVSAWEIYRAGR